MEPGAGRAVAGTINMAGSPEGMPNHQLISGVPRAGLSWVSRRGTFVGAECMGAPQTPVIKVIFSKSFYLSRLFFSNSLLNITIMQKQEPLTHRHQL